MTRPAPPSPVTDHVILRFMERVLGVDLDPVRAEILAICANGIQAGACTVRHGGWRFEIKQRRVVTVAPDHESPRWKYRTLEKHHGVRGRR